MLISQNKLRKPEPLFIPCRLAGCRDIQESASAWCSLTDFAAGSNHSFNLKGGADVQSSGMFSVLLLVNNNLLKCSCKFTTIYQHFLIKRTVQSSTAASSPLGKSRLCTNRRPWFLTNSLSSWQRDLNGVLPLFTTKPPSFLAFEVTLSLGIFSIDSFRGGFGKYMETTFHPVCRIKYQPGPKTWRQNKTTVPSVSFRFIEH